MTHVDVANVRRAEVWLGDFETRVEIEAAHDGHGEFAELRLVQIHENQNQVLADMTICEAKYAEELVRAVLAVLPAENAANIRGAAGRDDEPEDDEDRIEREEALREEAMILSSAAGHLKQARRHQDGAG